MFYYASKILWFFVQPSSLLLVLLAAGLALAWRGRTRLGWRLMGVAAVLYGLAGLSPLGNAVILPLEERFPRASLAEDAPPEGIIVLGGAVDTLVSRARGGTALNEAAERMTELAVLARRFPRARVVFSGGSGGMLYHGMTEAEAARRLYAGLGLEPDRLLFEDRSRNTHQNAAFSRALVDPRPGERWLLITSAYHMPRAMGVFRAAGFAVEPWPVDYRTRGADDLTRFFSRPSEGLRRMDLAVREWIGLLVYWLTDRTAALLPE